jgi:hypothetical protein
MSAHTKTQQYGLNAWRGYCKQHERYFNACCWECEEERGDVYADDPPEIEETTEEREKRRVETYREATRDEERIEQN